MNLFPGATPAFLTRNYLNRFAYKAGDVVVSSGEATKHRLFDMDPLSRWQSQESDDLTTETIEFGLWLPGARSSFDVENIFIMNHNIANLVVQHSNTNGAPWTTAFNKADVAEENTRIQLVSTAMDRILISAATTQEADEEKAIGDIIVAGAAFQPGPLFEYVPEPPKVQMKTAKMHDGSLRGQMIGRSDASYSFWAAKVGFLIDDEDDRATFRTYGLTGATFLFQPEPGDRPEEIYLCRVRPGTYNDPYARLSKSNDLVAVSMVIEEIGGA